MANKSKEGKARLLLVDDHPMMRQGLTQLVSGERDLEVVGEANDAQEAMRLVESVKPDLVVADITLPDKSGLDLLKDLQAMENPVPVLIISMHDESLYAERVLRAGGRGYIMKEQGGKKIIEAIRRVLSGQIYVSEKLNAILLETLTGRRADSGRGGLGKLSDREFEIFQLIGKGRSTQEIAKQLHLSPKTVEVHRANIKQKLGLASGAELVRHAIRLNEAQGNR
jgi:DNA-binding NarL/FixJ family response regulator